MPQMSLHLRCRPRDLPAGAGGGCCTIGCAAAGWYYERQIEVEYLQLLADAYTQFFLSITTRLRGRYGGEPERSTSLTTEDNFRDVLSHIRKIPQRPSFPQSSTSAAWWKPVTVSIAP